MSADECILAPVLAWRGLRLVQQLLSGTDLTTAQYVLLTQITVVLAMLPHGHLLCHAREDPTNTTNALDTDDKGTLSMLLGALLDACQPVPPRGVATEGTEWPRSPSGRSSESVQTP